MKCPFCNSEEYVIWSSKKSQFKCKKCNRIFTPNSNPNRGLIKDGQKWCSKCDKWKPLSEFGMKKYKDQKIFRSQCKTCGNLLSKECRDKDGGSRYTKYGITKEIFDECIKKNNNCCPICNKQLKKSHIDHDHKTGEFRGVICFKCNGLLGMCGDDINILKNSIEYLQNTSNNL